MERPMLASVDEIGCNSGYVTQNWPSLDPHDIKWACASLGVMLKGGKERQEKHAMHMLLLKYEMDLNLVRMFVLLG